MAFTPSLVAAAHRHRAAAAVLESGSRRDVAGYLYGIAAECAVKALMLEAGLRPVQQSNTSGDPFFAHFPELRTLLRERQLGRIGSRLVRYINDDSFMNHLNLRMLYCDRKEIKNQYS